MLRTLRDWIQNPKHAGTYTFRENNCSGLLLKWLHKSGFELNDDYTYFPFDIPNELRIRKIVKTPPLYVYNLDDDIRAVDKAFYQRCLNKKCKNHKREMAYDLWGKEKTDKFYNIIKDSSKAKHDLFVIRFFRWLGALKDIYDKEDSIER